MFEELNNLTGWNLKNLPENQVILICDDNVDASFLLHHFISFYLKAGQEVILLNAAQTFAHYNVACSKLGVNLDRTKSEGGLHLIDLLAASLEEYLDDEDVALEGDDKDSLTHIFKGRSVKQIYLQIKNKLSSQRKTAIILDDFSVFSALGFSDNDLTTFLHYMTVLCKSSGCTFVTLFHKNIATPSLYLNCQFYSTCEISVCGLESGYSKDVHGSLTLCKKENEWTDTIATVKEMQYKVTDRTVRLFAPGTSAAVL